MRSDTIIVANVSSVSLMLNDLFSLHSSSIFKRTGYTLTMKRNTAHSLASTTLQSQSGSLRDWTLVLSSSTSCTVSRSRWTELELCCLLGVGPLSGEPPKNHFARVDSNGLPRMVSPWFPHDVASSTYGLSQPWASWWTATKRTSSKRFTSCFRGSTDCRSLTKFGKTTSRFIELP